MTNTPTKRLTLFQAIEHAYNSQHYGSGDYHAKVRALHHLLQRKAIDRLAQRLDRFIQDSARPECCLNLNTWRTRQ
jgi:hypothetical protein